MRVGASLAWKNRNLIGQIAKAGIKYAQKYRGNGSKTKTKTQRKFQDQNQLEISQHNDLSEKSLGNIQLGPRKLPFKSFGGMKYRNCTQIVFGQQQGYQAVDYTEILLHRDNLVGNTNLSTAARTAVPDDIFFFNAKTGVDANTVHNNTPFPAILKEDKIALRSVLVKQKFLSLSTTAQKVTVYWVTPHYDGAFDPVSDWIQVLTQKSETQNAPFVSKTSVGPQNFAASTPLIGLPGENPWIHREFRKRWKVLKKSKFILQPGDQRFLNLKIHYNRVFNRNTFVNLRTSPFLKNITVIPFVIVESGLVGLELNEIASTKAAEVAPGPPKIGIYSEYLCDFAGVPMPRIEAARSVVHTVTNIQAPGKMVQIDDEDNIVDPDVA